MTNKILVSYGNADKISRASYCEKHPFLRLGCGTSALPLWEGSVTIMYQVGEKVVHPMHGAGIVDEIVERTIDEETELYYALRLVLEKVLLYIPVRTSDELGIRPICTPEEAAAILKQLPSLEIDSTMNWNRRYRENMDRLRSGNLLEVAGVVKALTLRDRRRGLSTGEKRMLDLSKQILASELSLSLGQDPENMKKEVVELLCPRGRHTKNEGAGA